MTSFTGKQPRLVTNKKLLCLCSHGSGLGISQPVTASRLVFPTLKPKLGNGAILESWKQFGPEADGSL